VGSGFVDGEGCVGGSRCRDLYLVHDRHHDFGQANFCRNHNLTRRDDVMMENHESSMHERGKETENDGGSDHQVVIAQPHGNRYDHVIRLLLNPSHSEQLHFDSEQQTVVVVVEEVFHLHPAKEVLDYLSQL